ncbi:MAG: MFS transporter [Alphaproteobacteria bacterium]
MTSDRAAALRRDATLVVTGGMSGMTMALVAPALPGMVRHFADTPDIDLLARLVVALPTALLAVMAPLAGWFADRTGRRLPLIAATVVFMLAGLAPLLLDDLVAILASRLVLGGAMGVMYALAPALLGDWHDGPARPRAMAWYGVGSAGGGAVMVIAGGALAEYGWRMPFYLHAIALPLAIATVLWVRDVPRVVASDAIRTPTVAAPMPWPALLGIYAMIAVTGMAYMQMPLNLPFLFDERSIGGPGFIGVAIALSMLLQSLGGFAFPWFARRTGHAWIYSLVAGGVALGYLLLVFADGAALALVALAVFGLGMSQMFPNSSTWLMALTRPGVRARVIGGLVTAIYGGQFAAPFLLQPLVRAVGLPTAFVALAALVAATGAMVVLLGRRGTRHTN